jgi:Flp pilus assembly protein TadD
LLAAVAGTFVFSGAAAAQSADAAATPGADLRRQLGELAANPTSVSELVETGRTALALGDSEGALGFFTRASQLAPQDARVKAGLAAANARTGRPETALMLFSEALAAGAPEAEIAAERGLAYDLLGQPARAQQDYLASLKLREDPEVRRRLALSLAISGQREAALRLIDPQVRQGDRAGARARIMVLALSGDVNGANAAANAALPASAAQEITPFLTRLASLDAGQMAAAANLGRLPAGGGVRTAAATSRSADQGALAFAGGAGTSSLIGRLPTAPAETGAVRRRPGAVNSAARSAGREPASTPTRTLASASSPVAAQREAGRPVGNWTPPAVSSTAGTMVRTAAVSSVPQGLIQPHPFQPLTLLARTSAAPAGQALADLADEPVELAGATGGPRVPEAVVTAPADEPVLTNAAPATRPVQLAQVDLPAAQPAAQPTPQPVADPQEPEVQEAPVDGAAANLAVWNSGAAPAQSSTPARQITTRPGFSDVVATVSSLPTETASPSAVRRTPSSSRTSAATTERSSAPRASRGTSQTAAVRSAIPAARATTPSAGGNASRIWVQLGVSANRAGFNYEIGRMRRAAPDLFKDRAAFVAPIGSSHRLLVGPFPNAAAARTFVTGLKQKDIASLTWTSPAGTPVERFAAGR